MKNVLPKDLVDLMINVESSQTEEEFEDESSESDSSDSDLIC